MNSNLKMNRKFFLPNPVIHLRNVNLEVVWTYLQLLQIKIKIKIKSFFHQSSAPSSAYFSSFISRNARIAPSSVEKIQSLLRRNLNEKISLNDFYFQTDEGKKNVWGGIKILLIKIIFFQLIELRSHCPFLELISAT